MTDLVTEEVNLFESLRFDMTQRVSLVPAYPRKIKSVDRSRLHSWKDQLNSPSGKTSKEICPPIE